MSLSNQIDQDLSEAMKSHDESTRSTLRMLKAAIKNTSIAQGKELSDEDVVSVIQREIKQRRDSAEQYRQARPELAAQEEDEIAILQKYLPAQLSDEELKTIVQKAIEQTQASGPQDMGKVMAAVMPQIQGKAEGARVASLVQESLRHG